MRKPTCIQPGDTIAVVSPSSPVPEEDLRKGVALLEDRGYRVVLGEHVLATAPHCDYLAGTDEQRAADLNRMFAREDIDAIFCARGGYGAMRLLDLLDWDRIAGRPRVFVGYSDITSLHAALALRGWVTFHSTMVSSLWKLSPPVLDLFWRIVEKPEPVGILPADADGIDTIIPGSAEGELTGGNLCLLAQACGSRYAPDFRGKIVLIEDVNDAVYHADRDLTQLLHAGLLQHAAGFVIGKLTGWEKHEAAPPRNTPDALWREFFARLGKPTVANFPFGHEPHPLPLPLGIRAGLDADARTLTLLDAATAAKS